MSHDTMKIYEDVKELVEDEIHKIVKKDDIDEQGLMHLDKLVDIAKDIDTIFAMNDYSENEGGYSQMRRPMYYNDGDMMPMNGNSYQRRDSMGRYSNRYNWNKGYDNRYNGGYSREGELANRLHSLMDEATTDRERDAIRNALNQI